MPMTVPTLQGAANPQRGSAGFTERAGPRQQPPPALTPRLHHGLRRAGWPAAFGLLLMVVMLVVFYQMVRWSVQQAQLRHATDAAEAQAQWRCRLDRPRLPCDLPAKPPGHQVAVSVERSL